MYTKYSVNKSFDFSNPTPPPHTHKVFSNFVLTSPFHTTTSKYQYWWAPREKTHEFPLFSRCIQRHSPHSCLVTVNLVSGDSKWELLAKYLKTRLGQKRWGLSENELLTKWRRVKIICRQNGAEWKWIVNQIGLSENKLPTTWGSVQINCPQNGAEWKYIAD